MAELYNDSEVENWSKDISAPTNYRKWFLGADDAGNMFQEKRNLKKMFVKSVM